MSDDEGSPVPTEEKEEVDNTAADLKDPNVVTKFREAGEIANQALAHVIGLAKPGVKIVDLSSAGDAFIVKATSSIYNKKGTKIEKGLAFPTCVSPNNIVGHYSPLPAESKTLAAGDVVKIDLGVHIDGLVAVVAHTIVLNENAPITGRAADVIASVYTAADVVLRLLKPGTKNTEVTEALGKVAADYKCNPVGGVLSHQMTKFVIDGKKVIINKPDVEQKVEEVEFEQGEVWAIDIVMSTGEGKTKESENRTTVYKRAVETTYALKMKASRATLSDINKQAPTFPFSLRQLDEKTARLGITECATHGLVSPYPVLIEKDGEFVAHLKFTALLTAAGTVPITGLFQSPERTRATSEHKVSEAVSTILKQAVATASSAAKKKKNKKKPAAAAAAAAAGGATAAKKEAAPATAAAAAPAKTETKAAEPKKDAAASPAPSKTAAKKETPATPTPAPAAATPSVASPKAAAKKAAAKK